MAGQHVSISDTLFEGKGEIPTRVSKTLIYTKYNALDNGDKAQSVIYSIIYEIIIIIIIILLF